MTFLGLTMGEIGAIIGLLSMVSALCIIREQVTRPLIKAMDGLQLEIKQLDRTLTAEHLLLRQETLSERLGGYDKQWAEGREEVAV